MAVDRPLAAAVFLAGPLLGGWAMSARARPTRDDWYASLILPGWTPPKRAFPLVWTALYVSMGYAAWRVWGSGTTGSLTALFLVQLAVNYGWSVTFFGRRDARGAARLAAALCALVAVMAMGYSRVDPVAAWITVPYVAWTAFAAVLSARVRDLNSFRDRRMS